MGLAMVQTRELGHTVLTINTKKGVSVATRKNCQGSNVCGQDP